MQGKTKELTLPVASDWQQWQGRLGRAGDPPNCASPFRGTAELATRCRRFFLPTNHHPVQCSRKGSSPLQRGGKSRVKMARTDRAGPDWVSHRSRVGGPRSAGNHQRRCSASSTTAQQSPAVAARLRGRNGQSEQRIEERALQED